MDLIILGHDNIYTLYPLNYVFNFEIMDCFEYCDAFRKAMSTYNEEINRWVMNNGIGHFFGCVCQ